MDPVSFFIEFIVHLDTHLAALINQFGIFTYIILFAVVFCETGLVIFPFLPGDSLLFAAGALSAAGALDIALLFLLFSAAAIIGDSVNYWIGGIMGPHVFREKSRFLNHEYLMKAEKFYEKHGGKTIVLARFIPIIRTFTPFVAGIGKMNYPRFLAYNILGGLLWVSLFLFAGYFFGNIPVVKQNFGVLIVAIIVISLLPALFEFLRHHMKKRRAR
ncbi:MAG: DedA family protein [Candidatus Diapherotrites archaeon]